MNLKLYIDSNFEGCNLEDLRKLASKAGITVPPAAKDEWIKRALIAHHNGTPAEPPPDDGTKPPVDIWSLATMPNLTQNGKWGGRKRRIVLHNNTGDATMKGMTVHWYGVPWSVPFEKQIDIGEPWYNVMRGCMTTNHAIREYSTAEGVKRVDLVESPQRVFQFDDLGVTPGTDHLPGSLIEFYQTLARKRDYFRKFNRRALLRVMSDLRPEIGTDKARTLSDADLLETILQFLGPEFVNAIDYEDAEA